jgi:hypothetical protein
MEGALERLGVSFELCLLETKKEFKFPDFEVAEVADRRMKEEVVRSKNTIQITRNRESG